jgi:cellulose synthase/poly-beta-1,6-N-acetylglucosamine synthase-like glycosyltransferase
VIRSRTVLYDFLGFQQLIVPPMPRVSIIIPTARRPKLLVRAINSVLAQTMPEFEIIVVVDGPNPETIAVLKEITDKRVRVMKNETSLGLAPRATKASPWQRPHGLHFSTTMTSGCRQSSNGSWLSQNKKTNVESNYQMKCLRLETSSETIVYDHGRNRSFRIPSFD